MPALLPMIISALKMALPKLLGQLLIHLTSQAVLKEFGIWFAEKMVKSTKVKWDDEVFDIIKKKEDS